MFISNQDIQSASAHADDISLVNNFLQVSTSKHAHRINFILIMVAKLFCLAKEVHNCKGRLIIARETSLA